MKTTHLLRASFFSFLLLFALPPAAKAQDFFEPDQMQQDVTTVDFPTVSRGAERYLRLMARLSVFAMYCDSKGQLGYNLQVSRLRARTEVIDKKVQLSFGGQVPMFNVLEDDRNDESLRMVHAGIQPVCEGSEAEFLQLVELSDAELERIADVPPGDLEPEVLRHPVMPVMLVKSRVALPARRNVHRATGAHVAPTAQVVSATSASKRSVRK